MDKDLVLGLRHMMQRWRRTMDEETVASLRQMMKTMRDRQYPEIVISTVFGAVRAVEEEQSEVKKIVQLIEECQTMKEAIKVAQPFIKKGLEKKERPI